jgi:E3 ubiquitin-protein ligase UBR4
VDPGNVTMIDSIKVYVKTKEAFGWPEDAEDFAADAKLPSQVSSTGSAVINTGGMDGT